ncbi:DUF4861 domain-containing protein [Niveispirillum lacus]|uniref:DUF4861 domain-containing protein n=1 Tax=Niveispirillum lacus TaxID=1981099 RepID=A0A255YQV0_9PROT|nr:DUF4861 family protein [Niveispirillum lacus]OYQ31582.1 DUF4861 domain-containing protein [Niveispirillum lacus]
MYHPYIIALTVLTICCFVTAPAVSQEPVPKAQLPVQADRSPQARVTLADYRYDDLMWENDRTAHRIYGHALEAAEPPSGSGIDSWGKKVVWPFMDRQLRTRDYHNDLGEGLDFYNVGQGRGAGGLGIWQDNKLWTSRNFRAHRILKNGPDRAEFEVDYAPWPVDLDRKVWETRRFTLPLGSHFTRMVSTLSSDRPEPLIVGIGIGKKTTGNGGELTVMRDKGLISWWGPDDPLRGRMAVAVRVDPAMIVDVRQDADNHLVLLRVTPGQAFVYYSGSAWSRGRGGFTDRVAWDSHAAAEPVDFTVSAQ